MELSVCFFLLFLFLFYLCVQAFMTGSPAKDPCVSFYWMLKNAAEPPIGMPSRFSLVFILLSKPLICFLWQKNRLESPIMGMLSLHSFNRACYCLFSSICLLFISLVPPFDKLQ